MRIIITGQAVVHDWRNETVHDPAILRSLHGLAYTEERFTDYLDGSGPEKEVRNILERGGYLRFQYNSERNELECVTEYEAKRPLSEAELNLLVEYTTGQWSDGIGENFASNSVDECAYSIECLSRPQPAARQVLAAKGPPQDRFDRPAALRLSADRGNPLAALALAYWYAGGDPQDAAAACQLFAQAAQGGSCEAMLRLGECYADGKGTAARPADAAACFRKVAAADDWQWSGSAWGWLGRCHEEGIGVPKDEAEAVRSYLRSAESCVDWLPRLAACYELGKGTARDLRQALDCYRKALEAGYENVRSAILRFETELGIASK